MFLQRDRINPGTLRTLPIDIAIAAMPAPTPHADPTPLTAPIVCFGLPRTQEGEEYDIRQAVGVGQQGDGGSGSSPIRLSGGNNNYARGMRLSFAHHPGC